MPLNLLITSLNTDFSTFYLLRNTDGPDPELSSFIYWNDLVLLNWEILNLLLMISLISWPFWNYDCLDVLVIPLN